MKNIYDVLRQKEFELERLQKEIEALRLAVSLLNDEGDGREPEPYSADVPSGSVRPQSSPASAVREATPTVREATPAWGEAGLRQFP